MNRITEIKELRSQAKNIRKEFLEVDASNFTPVEKTDKQFVLLKRYRTVANEYYDKKFRFQPSLPRINYQDKS